ncbi:pentatricopeptide repeat-containing protein At2g02980, chloroplastic [Beta vulgaris subsp. vulgaris]|uniref:pentatricopeptide repeat-containing protein At2g02980, chloroplastic n=1 Tax=Beta vulgaris subsp. vulgaris TaxID=3555 RepID=UPI002036B9D1|nr:pentatricopeptide repeat-containing protein At2g02980, chloroplastic [Beta vulgaris subsp. vulgaris]XP_010685429.2 pentatricopeptide repeat-containing protein At2g02980, chloroplastic [Beta vulgaris subsp. vulgaris]
MHLPQHIAACASLLELCCTTKNLQQLQQIHCQTIKIGTSYNDFIRAKLISSYTSCAQLSDAHYIFSVTNRKSTFLYNTLIRGYASSKQFHLSLSCFHQMILARKSINVNTLPAVLKSVSALSLFTLGRRIHTVILVHGLSSDLAHCNALITMYGKCGDLHSARTLFDRRLERNLITWCAIMGGYAMHGNFDEVFFLFDRMLESGVSPDGAIFTTLLTACSHGGRIQKGRECFQIMVERFCLRPSMEHYTCMVDMLGRAGKIQEAVEVVEKMEMEPDEALWRALLGACRFHGIFQITVRKRMFILADQ